MRIGPDVVPHHRPAIGLALLAIAFVAIPPLIGGPGTGHVTASSELVDATVAAFAHWWTRDDAALTPELSRLVEFWCRFHLVKALFAIGIVAVGVLAVRRARTGVGRLSSIGAIGVGVVAAMANLQGAIAPLASLMSLLPAQMPAGTRCGPKSLTTMTSSFVTYHWTLAVLAGVSAVTLVALCWARWRTWSSSVLVALAVMSLGVLVAANVTTAIDPAPAVQSAPGMASCAAPTAAASH